MLLKICNVTFAYNSVDVLKNITFEAKEGEILGILGPNGAGKTTLLKCIFRALIPKHGVILLDGTDIKKFSQRELAKNMAVVMQEDIVAPFTVLETILMGRYPHLESPFKILDVSSSKFIEEIINMLELGKLLDRGLNEISGGERRRVHIARALVQQPKVLLLDEPTVHLDLNYQLFIMEIIKRYTISKRIITIATFHDLSLAVRFCDKVILMKNGIIFAAGKPEEVITPENIESVYNVRIKVIKEDGKILAVVPLEITRRRL